MTGAIVGVLLRTVNPIDLLSAPPTIPRVYCDINGLRRVSRGGEAMARRQKEERRVGRALVPFRVIQSSFCIYATF